MLFWTQGNALSVKAQQRTRLTGILSDAMAHAAERVTAAPPMSALKGVFR